MKNPESGFDPLLEERMRVVLPLCTARRIKIVTNLGAANPEGAVKKATEIARSLDLSSLKIAAVVGDHVLEAYKERDLPIMEFDGSIRQLGNRLLSANAYLGVEPMAQALNGGADVVITGRASDPALFLAPMMHDFGWATDDWNLLGQGTVAGHLLECAGQIAGGYFADPPYKDVPDLARLGLPIGEVGEDGSLVVTKVAGSGGAVTARPCKDLMKFASVWLAALKSCARRQESATRSKRSNGRPPAAGRGSRRDVIAIAFVLLSRELARPEVRFVEA